MFSILIAAQAIETPIVSYSFDAIEGDAVIDISGSGNDGTMEDGPNVINGAFGQALEFESSRVRIEASGSLSTELFKEGTFTLVMWINPSLAGNTWQQVFRAGPDPNDTLFLNVDGRLSWRGWVGGAWAGGMCETAAGVLAANVWSHAAVVSDTQNFRIYVNGELSEESAFQETRGNNQEFMIGGYTGGESFSGAVDDFAIFGAALDQADIEVIMNNGLESTATVDSEVKVATKWAALKRAF
jgi:hypothetical protein